MIFNKNARPKEGRVSEANMKPILPIKKFCFGLETMSFSTTTCWFEFCNENSFDTRAEIEDYMRTNDWSKDGHPHSGICEMSDEDLRFYNEYWEKY